MKPDAVIEVRFKATAGGGRKSSIVTTTRPYGCSSFVDGEAFDCRLLINGATLELGCAGASSSPIPV
jgi:hypothetical protein